MARIDSLQKYLGTIKFSTTMPIAKSRWPYTPLLILLVSLLLHFTFHHLLVAYFLSIKFEISLFYHNTEFHLQAVLRLIGIESNGINYFIKVSKMSLT